MTGIDWSSLTTDLITNMGTIEQFPGAGANPLNTYKIDLELEGSENGDVIITGIGNNITCN